MLGSLQQLIARFERVSFSCHAWRTLGSASKALMAKRDLTRVLAKCCMWLGMIGISDSQGANELMEIGVSLWACTAAMQKLKGHWLALVGGSGAPFCSGQMATKEHINGWCIIQRGKHSISKKLLVWHLLWILARFQDSGTKPKQPKKFDTNEAPGQYSSFEDV